MLFYVVSRHICIAAIIVLAAVGLRTLSEVYKEKQKLSFLILFNYSYHTFHYQDKKQHVMFTSKILTESSHLSLGFKKST